MLTFLHFVRHWLDQLPINPSLLCKAMLYSLYSMLICCKAMLKLLFSEVPCVLFLVLVWSYIVVSKWTTTDFFWEKLNDIYVDVSVCTTNYSHTQMLYSSTALNRVVDVHMNVLDTTQEIQEKDVWGDWSDCLAAKAYICCMDVGYYSQEFLLMLLYWSYVFRSMSGPSSWYYILKNCMSINEKV
jgi:hypothetical protein